MICPRKAAGKSAGEDATLAWKQNHGRQEHLSARTSVSVMLIRNAEKPILRYSCVCAPSPGPFVVNHGSSRARAVIWWVTRQSLSAKILPDLEIVINLVGDTNPVCCPLSLEWLFRSRLESRRLGRGRDQTVRTIPTVCCDNM